MAVGVLALAGHACPRRPLLSPGHARGNNRRVHRRTNERLFAPPVRRRRARDPDRLRLVDSAPASHLARDLYDLSRGPVELRLHLTSPAKAGCAVADEDDVQYVLIQHRQVFEPQQPLWSGLVDQYGNALVHQRDPIGFLRNGI